MEERQAWNDWNSRSGRSDSLGRVQLRQAELIESWLATVAGPVRVLEVGCGTGWLVERMASYGSVVGIDLADDAISQLKQRFADRSEIEVLAGEFLSADLGVDETFDAVVAVETMAHFRDQAGFLRRASELLKPGGLLMIAAQNRPMMERNIKFLPNHGWYRKWLDKDELRSLVEVDFEVISLSSVEPIFFEGPLHWANSEKLGRLLGRFGMRRPIAAFKRWEESRFLGFSLMCLSRKRS